MSTTQTITLSLLAVITCSFLLGVDRGLEDKQHRADMYRYCQSAGHSDSLCYGVTP